MHEATLALLDRIRGAGLRLALGASAHRRRIDNELTASGLRDFFETVVSGDDVVRDEPHPEGLLDALRRMKLQSEDTLYIGDAPEDVEMARAARALSVGVPSSYPSNALLGPFAPVPDLRSIATFLQTPTDHSEVLTLANQRLAVRESLAPGGKNAGMLAHLIGSWHGGKVHGALRDEGPGASLGFTGLVLDPDLHPASLCKCCPRR